MRYWHILTSRLRSLFRRARREADLREELQLHLDRERERLEAGGMPPEAARFQALRIFGAVESTKDACRDARGTAIADNLVRDVRYAGRSFRRAPLAALTIVTTLGLGLGLVAVVFTVFNAFVFLVDEVHRPYELFAVQRSPAANAPPETFSRGQHEALLRETGIFTDAFARTPEIDSWIEGRRLEGPLVTGNFFQVLGVGAVLGRALTPSDDEPGGPSIIVLSHGAWSRHFAADPAVLHRTVQVNGASFQVVGVMPPGFRGLTVSAPDYWAPLSLIGHFRRGSQDGPDLAGLEVVGRLKPGLSRGQALAPLNAWDIRRAVERQGERPAASLVLEPQLGTVPQPAEALVVFMPLFFAFGLILLIGCANVANLLLARGVARQREIGIRLSIGASRRRVIWQLLTENLLLALAAAALGFGVSRVVLRVIVHVLTSTFPPDFGNIRLVIPPADWRVVLFLVAAAMLSTLLFALAPALQATRVELVRAVRGEVVRDARPGRARDALVALQVTGSVLLLILAAVFLRSTWAAAAADPGVRTIDVVNVGILDEQRRGAVLDVVEGDPSITAVAASWPGGLGGRAAFAAGAAGKSSITYQFVSPGYLEVLGIDVVRGRAFTSAERSASAAVAVVSEDAARLLWPGADAIGQVVRLEPDATREALEPDEPPLLSQQFIVVGVARNVAGFRLGGHRMAGTGVYLPIDARAARTALTLRVRGDSGRVRDGLVNRFAGIDPNLAEVVTLGIMARIEAYLLAIPFWLTLVLGALALALTLSGLFSVLSYLVEQRSREIGVRMAIGATRRNIATLVLLQLIRPVGLGLILGGSLTAALGAALLATPVAEEIGSAVRLFDPIAYAVSLCCVIAACTGASLIPAWRAGRIDPVGAIRQD